VVGIGVIGCGYWGPNLIRNFSALPVARVVAVADVNPARLVDLQLHETGALRTSDADELIRHPGVDAVVIATPASTHFALALKALHAGKHVLVEKPLATASALAERLIDEAARRDRVLLVDHTFVYAGAVRKLHELLATNALGDVLYYDSVRINLGRFRHDLNVLWDLAAHDLAIMDYLLPQRPCAVSATGVSHVLGWAEDVAYVTLFFDDNLIAHVHANWLAPVKIRQTLIGGRQKMVVYDDLEPVDKLKVYDRGIVVEADPDMQSRIGYREGEMSAPSVDAAEPLRTMAEHFVQCVVARETPVSGGDAGLRVVQLLEAASQSMMANGQPVDLARRADVA
jgi:predicted dehydrogenase